MFPTRTAVRDILEKLIMAHPIEEFPAFYVTARFIVQPSQCDKSNCRAAEEKHVHSATF
jgi:hypothetical protein